jgi:hypothetical protein
LQLERSFELAEKCAIIANFNSGKYSNIVETRHVPYPVLRATKNRYRLPHI